MGLAGQERKPNLWKVCDLGYGGAEQDVAAQVIVAQEAERRRFSREMHDDLAQKVALLEFQIEGMKRKLSPRHRASAELECLRGSVAMLAEDLHRICYRLHPVVLDNLGLVAGLEFLCGEFARTSGVNPKFTSEAVPDELPQNVALCMYRVIQEALSNANKHAHAREVTVFLNGVKNELRAIVSDNGRGFDMNRIQAKSGLGLTFICERVRLLGGSSSIGSTPGRGTRVEVFVPLSSPDLD